MPDKSFIPCKRCDHPKKEHSSHFGICYHEKGTCKCYKFERIENLNYLEWCYEQDKEKI